jgi:hypothetical protein
MSTSPDPKNQPAFFPLVDLQQKIYPRSVSGRFAQWRWAMVWLTQIVFYGLPWLTPEVVAGQVDVLPAQRRQVLQQRVIDSIAGAT